MNATPLQLLGDYGQSPWVSGLTRRMLDGGTLGRLVAEHGISGVAAELASWHEALAAGQYDAALTGRAAGAGGRRVIVREVICDDVRRACDVLRPIWDARGNGDGAVSVPVDPSMWGRPDLLAREALALVHAIDRPNVMVAVPATAPGVAALETLTAVGVSVDARLIASPECYSDVAGAYQRGLERAVESGRDPRRIVGAASVSVGEIAAGALGAREHVAGVEEMLVALGTATATLIHQRFRDLYASERWSRLERYGARPQRCHWVVGVAADCDFCCVLQVEELIGSDTVCVLTPDAIAAFEDQGVVAEHLERNRAAADRALAGALAARVDMERLWDTVHVHGVARAATDMQALLAAAMAAAHPQAWARGRD
jgi:transaldolase